MSRSSYFESRSNLLTLGGVGGGNWKSWKTLIVEESGRSLVDRISKCPRYVIEITVLDSLSLRELGKFFSDLASLVLLDMLGR